MVRSILGLPVAPLGVKLAALASILAIPGVPLLLVLGLFASEASAYHGVCGPYPTDIPAYPCGFGDYLQNLFDPFSLAGATAIWMLATCAMAGILATVWVIGGGTWMLARKLAA